MNYGYIPYLIMVCTIIQTYDPLDSPQIANYSICFNKSKMVYIIINYGICHN